MLFRRSAVVAMVAAAAALVVTPAAHADAWAGTSLAGGDILIDIRGHAHTQGKIVIAFTRQHRGADGKFDILRLGYHNSRTDRTFMHSQTHTSAVGQRVSSEFPTWLESGCNKPVLDVDWNHDGLADYQISATNAACI